jgi:hypothetical protein
MHAVGFVVVSSQPSRAEAELLAGLLRSGGVRAVVESLEDARYPVGAMSSFRVSVPADQAAQAQELLTQASHLDAADPTSSLDVGQPVDDEVRDYLDWKRESGESDDDDETPPAPVATADIGSMHLQPGRLPLLPLLGLVALVVALVVLLR